MCNWGEKWARLNWPVLSYFLLIRYPQSLYCRKIGPLGLKNRSTVSKYLFQRNIISTPTYLNVILSAPSYFWFSSPPPWPPTPLCSLLLSSNVDQQIPIPHAPAVLPSWNGLLSYPGNRNSLLFFYYSKFTLNNSSHLCLLSWGICLANIHLNFVTSP